MNLSNETNPRHCWSSLIQVALWSIQSQTDRRLLQNSEYCSIGPVVQWLKTIFVFALALAWVPLTSHCKLEGLPGLSFLACESKDAQKPDCGDSGCCDFEFTEYRSDSIKVTCPPVILMVALALAQDDLAPNFAHQEILPPITAPPELPPSWQFLSRTALPPRAPSFLS